MGGGGIQDPLNEAWNFTMSLFLLPVIRAFCNTSVSSLAELTYKVAFFPSTP